jgi:hypothetical protein
MRLAHYYLLLTLSLSLHANSVRDFWFSGAELNRYELSQIRYGEAHPGHAELVFVTEPFLTEKQVKNETGTGPSADVLKLNAMRTFNTGIYSYRTMTSTFQPIDLKNFPHALKSNTSVQEWCGQFFQQLNRSSDGWRGELRSYFQEEGDRDLRIGDALLEDAVWLKLRLAPEQLPTGPIEVIPGGLYTRFNHTPPQIQQAVAERSVDGKLNHYRIHYSSIERTLEISYDSKFPHIIRGWKEIGPAGTTQAELTHRIMNSEYWNQSKASDAHIRSELGLDPIAN